MHNHCSADRASPFTFFVRHFGGHLGGHIFGGKFGLGGLGTGFEAGAIDERLAQSGFRSVLLIIIIGRSLCLVWLVCQINSTDRTFVKDSLKADYW